MRPRHAVRITAAVAAFAAAFAAASLVKSRLAGHKALPEVPPARPKAERVFVPGDVGAPAWLDARRRAQAEAGKAYGVFHDFRFHDRLEQSGIGFRHQILDDSGKNYIPVHYDHGSGLAAADVDGDGRVDVYFVNQGGDDALFRNLGGGRFEDVTRRSGVTTGGGVGVGASFADVDNDGDPDLYVTRVRTGNRLFENLGDGRFRDVSAGSGLDHRGHSSGAVFFDYDRDGLVDLFLANVGRYTSDAVAVNSVSPGRAGAAPVRYHAGLPDAFAGHLSPDRSERSILFRNLGGCRFADVSEQTGLVHSGWTGDATPFDGNGDGWTDLYVLNMQGDDHYYENVDGTRFVDRTREVFPLTPWGSMGVKAFDFDNDGRDDLFVTDMHSDMSEEVGPDREGRKSRIRWAPPYLATEGTSLFGNAVYRNLGGGRFEEVSDRLGAETYWPWGVSVGDLNADGYDDVFVTAGMNYPFRYAVNSVLLNDRGVQFLPAEFLLNVEPRRGGRTAVRWFERDCATAPVDEGPPECQGRDGPVEVWGAIASRSSAVFDLDGDGDLDVLTNDFGSEPMVLVSDLAQTGREVNSLGVSLTGRASNRGGLGARVTVTAGSRSFHRVHDGKSGYLSQSACPLYFGLGGARVVDRVEVRWPSGLTQVVPGPVRANTMLNVREDAGAARSPPPARPSR